MRSWRFYRRHLVDSLMKDGHEVICADIKPLEYWFQIFDQNKNYSLDLKEYENCIKFLVKLIIFIIWRVTWVAWAL